MHAKQKQVGAAKKCTAKQSRIKIIYLYSSTKLNKVEVKP